MIRIAIFFLCLFGFTFKDQFEKAKTGDYVITHQNRLYTILFIREYSPPSRLVLEEISVPDHFIQADTISWQKWIDEKAPGHSSWIGMEIDLKTGTLLQCYDFMQQSYLQLSDEENFLSKLLTLPLIPVSESKKRRIGPPPQGDEQDHRPFWNPPLIRNREKEKKPQFDIYETKWPNDGSELAGKELHLYFDHNRIFVFPYWIELVSGHFLAMLQAIDTGTNFHSSKPLLPLSFPSFYGKETIEEKMLVLHLFCPSYFNEFSLFAFEVKSKNKELIPLSFSQEKKENMLHLKISLQSLENFFKHDHLYHWLLISKENEQIVIQSKLPYLWENPKH